MVGEAWGGQIRCPTLAAVNVSRRNVIFTLLWVLGSARLLRWWSGCKDSDIRTKRRDPDPGTSFLHNSAVLRLSASQEFFLSARWCAPPKPPKLVRRARLNHAEYAKKFHVPVKERVGVLWGWGEDIILANNHHYHASSPPPPTTTTTTTTNLHNRHYITITDVIPRVNTNDTWLSSHRVPGVSVVESFCLLTLKVAHPILVSLGRFGLGIDVRVQRSLEASSFAGMHAASPRANAKADAVVSVIEMTVSGGVRQDPNGAGGKERAVLVFRSPFYSTVLRQGLSRAAAAGSPTAVELPTHDNNDSGDGESNGGDCGAPRKAEGRREQGRGEANGKGRPAASSGIWPTVTESGVLFATADGAPRTTTSRSEPIRGDKDGLGDHWLEARIGSVLRAGARGGRCRVAVPHCTPRAVRIARASRRYLYARAGEEPSSGRGIAHEDDAALGYHARAEQLSSGLPVTQWLVRRGLGLGAAAAGGLAPAEEKDFQEVGREQGVLGGNRDTGHSSEVRRGNPLSEIGRSTEDRVGTTVTSSPSTTAGRPWAITHCGRDSS
ncbi:hypothetical protein EDB89DRAFT_1903279 [Lactarius sanguifluus]|nr:hypothetical protein EDB89DRAFT_1903279 [Lactarius sanguifluus]